MSDFQKAILSPEGIAEAFSNLNLYDGCIVFSDNLPFLRSLPDSSIDLIYIDPPFNTGKAQARLSLWTVADPEKGDRIGFGGRRYQTIQEGEPTYADSFEDYLGFLRP
ncbi:MAG: hypothetical protein RMK98_09165, partial [Bacteroidia bacterium]|nr:hypothetical protein [Bacteroidia bacterium]